MNKQNVVLFEALLNLVHSVLLLGLFYLESCEITYAITSCSIWDDDDDNLDL